jgi:hypothetical protein
LAADSSGPRLHYRLNALVDRASDQGVLPHLLAHGALNRWDPFTVLTMGTDVTVPSRARSVEIDLFGVHAGRLIMGEVKTKAEDFDSAQLRRDMSLARELGVDDYIAAAVYGMDDAIAAQIRAATERAHLGVIILGTEHLRPLASVI